VPEQEERAKNESRGGERRFLESDVSRFYMAKSRLDQGEPANDGGVGGDD
jgi:hypothetical protein